MIKKIFYITIILLSFISIAKAEGLDPAVPGEASQYMLKIQQDFNRQLTSSMTSSLMNNKIVGWNTGGLTKTIFAICFLIALAQALSNKSPTGMVTEMTKLAFYSWLIIAMLGGPTYQRFDFLKINDPSYNSSGQKSLDIDIFNFVAYYMDSAADQMFSSAGPQELLDSSLRNKNISDNLMNARKYCAAGAAGASCLRSFMQDKLVDPKTVTDTNIQKTSGSWGIPDFLIEMFQKIYLISSDLNLLFFYLVSWLVDLIRAVANIFIQITFGIITGTSFFLMKFIFPFAVLKKYRGKVFSAMKVPLSATLYGFMTSLIVYISSVGFIALNEASTLIIFKRLADGNAATTLITMNIISFSVFTGMLIFSLLQLFAMIKIPQLSKDLLNLSFDSLVGFFKEVVTVGIGAASALAGGFAGASLAAAGGTIGKVTGSLTGGTGGLADTFGKVTGRFSGGGGAPTSLFKDNKISNNLKSSSVDSIGGMQSIAQESSLKVDSTTSSAGQLAMQDLVPKKEEVIEKKKTKKKDSKKINTSYLESLMNVGAGKTSGAEQILKKDIVQEGVGAITEGLEDVRQQYLDPEKYAEEQRILKESRGDLENNSLIGSVISSAKNTDIYKAFQNNQKLSKEKAYQSTVSSIDKLSSVFSKTRLNYKDQSESLLNSENSGVVDNDVSTEILSKIKSNEKLSVDDINNMMKVKRENKIEDLESDNLIAQSLYKEVETSLKNIEEGSDKESDFELAYKSQNVGYLSEAINKKREQLSKNNENFKSYIDQKNKENKELLEKLKSSNLSNNEENKKMIEELNKRIESGLISKDSYEEIANYSNDPIESNGDNNILKNIEEKTSKNKKKRKKKKNN